MLDDVLKEADGLVHGARNKTYGHPLDDYRRVVDIFRAITGIELTPDAGALFMLSVKLARLGHNYEQDLAHRDSIVDAAGYLWCFGVISEALGKSTT